MRWREGQVLVIGNNATIWLHKKFAWDKAWTAVLKDQLQPWLYKKLMETGNWDNTLITLVEREAVYIKHVARATDKDAMVLVALLYIDAIDRYVLATDNEFLLVPAKHRCRRCGRERTGPSVCWLCGHP